MSTGRPTLHYIHGTGCPVCGSPLHRDGHMAVCAFCKYAQEIVSPPK